jgi:hypothetical protein
MTLLIPKKNKKKSLLHHFQMLMILRLAPNHYLPLLQLHRRLRRPWFDLHHHQNLQHILLLVCILQHCPLHQLQLNLLDLRRLFLHRLQNLQVLLYSLPNHQLQLRLRLRRQM